MRRKIEREEGKSLLAILIALLAVLLVFLFSSVMPERGLEASLVKGDEKGSFKKEGVKKEEGFYSSKDILQFRSGGLILGFKEDRVYMVGMGYVLIEEFVGAKKVKPVAMGGKSSEKEEGKGVPLFSGVVRYAELWEGIELRYEAREGGLAESVFIIKPGADPERIRLNYNAEVEVEKDGRLKLTPSGKKGYFTISAPKAWQEIGGKMVPVEVAFRKVKDNTVGFRVADYNRAYPLIIDPTYQWHTFYGSANEDKCYGIAVDGRGNVYVTGYSRATWNGPSAQSPLHAYSGGTDIFVLKLNSFGAYQWHTFYGSANEDEGWGIAVDGSGNVYVTGRSKATWDGPSGQSPLHAFSGLVDIFILKLNSNGTYQWHTFYGSASDDYAYGIAVDGSGNVYVTGRSKATWDGPSGQSPLHAFSGNWDIVVLKLNSAGAYQWHTFYGSSAGWDWSFGIAVDGNGNLYVTGGSSSTWDGPLGQSPLHAYSGNGWDIFVLKLNSAGTYQWHTFYGSGLTGENYGYSIAVDGDGDVYVTGSSWGTWHGPSGQSPLHAYSGYDDIFVLKLNSNGAYQWHTFYGAGSYEGGGSYDRGYGIAVDENGNVYVAGWSSYPWHGPSGQSPLHAYSGNRDIVVLKLNSNGAYQWHTFYGAAYDDFSYGIAVDGSGNVYVTGYGYNTWNGPSGESPLHAYSGDSDIVVLKMSDSGGLTCTPPFTDISCDRQFFNEIKWMKDRGISKGYGDGTYRPDEPVTRAAMAVFIVRAMYGDDFTYPTTPYFADVPPEHPFFKYIQKFRELGITKGCGETTFCPNNNVRRDEMAVFLVRAKVGDNFTYSETPYFSDVPPNHYFFKYIQKFKELGITMGYPDGTYRPSENVKRDAMAAFLYRAFGK